jgi:hypothetical protein
MGKYLLDLGPMMGARDLQAPMWSYRVNLDKQVRGDHGLRGINEVLDLGFVRRSQRVASTRSLCDLRPK